jgi:plasmid stabilization system protein ParE
VEILKTFPNAGRQRESSSKLRYYPVHPYIISYQVDELSEVITIVGVVHASMAADVDEIED